MSRLEVYTRIVSGRSVALGLTIRPDLAISPAATSVVRVAVTQKVDYKKKGEGVVTASYRIIGIIGSTPKTLSINLATYNGVGQFGTYSRKAKSFNLIASQIKVGSTNQVTYSTGGSFFWYTQGYALATYTNNAGAQTVKTKTE